MPIPPASVGASKFGALTKPSAPVVLLMVNLAASARSEERRVGKDWASGSPATTVVTAVEFSATLAVAVAPPPFELIAGASLTLVTVTVFAGVAVPRRRDVA